MTRLCVRAPLESDAPQQLPIGEAGGSEETVVALHQVVLSQYSIEVEPGSRDGGHLVI
jgi:hypothetical protein